MVEHSHGSTEALPNWANFAKAKPGDLRVRRYSSFGAQRELAVVMSR